jgi:hypothetical protein
MHFEPAIGDRPMHGRAVLIYSGGTPATQSETDGAWHSFAGVFTTTGAASFVNVDGSRAFSTYHAAYPELRK